MITLSEFQLSTFYWNFYFDFSEPPQPTQNCTRANGFFPFPANESCQKFWDCRGGSTIGARNKSRAGCGKGSSGESEELDVTSKAETESPVE